MHDLLFSNIRSLGQPGKFEELAKQIPDIDMKKWKASLDDPTLREQVEYESAFSDSLGIKGTPGIT